MSDAAQLTGEDIYVGRLLAHAAAQRTVAENTIFQLSIMLARAALEEGDAIGAQETVKVLSQCIRNKPALASNVVDLNTFRALRA
jgi:hypothetical protein